MSDPDTIASDYDRNDAPLVVAYGAGTNSTAMVIGLLEKGERPDAVVFSDTGGERPNTYCFLDLFEKWLSAHELTLTRVRHSGIHRTLEEKCLTNHQLPSIAFGMKSCSSSWKRDPQEKWATAWPPARDAWGRGRRCVKALGFDIGEERRAKIADDHRWHYRYPLIEWKWDREDCVAAIARAGLPQPGKSSCFFCPAMTKREVLQLAAQYPDLMKRALAMERTFREHNQPFQQTIGLGRKFTWEQLVSHDNAQQRLFDNTPEISCDCYDGEPDE